MNRDQINAVLWAPKPGGYPADLDLPLGISVAHHSRLTARRARQHPGTTDLDREIHGYYAAGAARRDGGAAHRLVQIDSRRHWRDRLGADWLAARGVPWAHNLEY